MITKRIFFKTNNLYAQDGIVDEYEIGKTCKVDIQGIPVEGLQELTIGTQSVQSPLGNVSIPDYPELGFTHLHDDTYDVVGHVYAKNHSAVFMDIGEFEIMICDEEGVLEVGKDYTGQLKFIFDPWNCGLFIDEAYQNTIDISGVVKSILVDTSPFIQDDKGVFSKEGVPEKFDLSIDKTSCWDDEKYTNGFVYYLIEIEVEFEEPMTLRPMTDEEMQEDEGMQEIFAVIREKIDGQHRKADNGDVAAMFNLGELAYNSKDYENAFKHWKRAIQTDFKTFVNELRTGFATYCRGALSVMAECENVGIDADTAIPVCNDFDKGVAINYYLDKHFGRDQWKAISELTEGAVLALDIEHNGVVDKTFFNIANFYGDSGFNSAGNWDFHNV